MLARMNVNSGSHSRRHVSTTIHTPMDDSFRNAPSFVDVVRFVARYLHCTQENSSKWHQPQCDTGGRSTHMSRRGDLTCSVCFLMIHICSMKCFAIALQSSQELFSLLLLLLITTTPWEARDLDIYVHAPASPSLIEEYVDLICLSLVSVLLTSAQ